MTKRGETLHRTGSGLIKAPKGRNSQVKEPAFDKLWRAANTAPKKKLFQVQGQRRFFAFLSLFI